jgi:hypothetical protein
MSDLLFVRPQAGVFVLSVRHSRAVVAGVADAVSIRVELIVVPEVRAVVAGAGVVVTVRVGLAAAGVLEAAGAGVYQVILKKPPSEQVSNSRMEHRLEGSGKLVT